MIDSTWLLVIDVIKWILVSRSTYSSINAAAIAVQLHLHQDLTLTFLRILISLENILRFPEVTTFWIIFFNGIGSYTGVKVHHCFSRVIDLRHFLPSYIVITLNYNILTLSANQNLSWNSRIQFSTISFQFVSLGILIT